MIDLLNTRVDCGLVCNHRDGPNWISATQVEVLGPVTYIIETENGSRWKRHADQIKVWLSRVTTDTGNGHQDDESFDDSNHPELNDTVFQEKILTTGQVKGARPN